MKRIVQVIAILTVAILTFTACDTNSTENQSGSNLENLKSDSNVQSIGNLADYQEIKFSDMYDTKGTEKNVSIMLQNLDGKKVKLKGYPAVQSPLDESFVYLNNQPYVTCPFCTIGDITKLEVIPIFMADGSKIQYTEDGMNVYGTLEIGEKTDSEGYTTQFRIYADKVEKVESSDTDKKVQNYYATLSEAGMIYDIQTLQMNIEYVSNPDYMTYYGETKKEIVTGIVEEYISYDNSYAQNFGEGYNYLVYILECPEIVKACEPADENLKQLNDELIQLYQDEIIVLKKYSELVYQYQDKDLSEQEAETAYNEFVALNAENLKLYNQFTDWNNKLRES